MTPDTICIQTPRGLRNVPAFMAREKAERVAVALRKEFLHFIAWQRAAAPRGWLALVDQAEILIADMAGLEVLRGGDTQPSIHTGV